MLLRLNAVTYRKEKSPSALSYIKSSVSLKYWFSNPANNNNLLGTKDINRAISDVDLMTQMISASVIAENVNITPFSSLLKQKTWSF